MNKREGRVDNARVVVGGGGSELNTDRDLASAGVFDLCSLFKV
jgi:hypothetical protein